jgi:hypothetical protein
MSTNQHTKLFAFGATERRALAEAVFCAVYLTKLAANIATNN